MSITPKTEQPTSGSGEWPDRVKEIEDTVKGLQEKQLALHNRFFQLFTVLAAAVLAVGMAFGFAPRQLIFESMIKAATKEAERVAEEKAAPIAEETAKRVALDRAKTIAESAAAEKAAETARYYAAVIASKTAEDVAKKTAAIVAREIAAPRAKSEAERAIQEYSDNELPKKVEAQVAAELEIQVASVKIINEAVTKAQKVSSLLSSLGKLRPGYAFLSFDVEFDGDPTGKTEERKFNVGPLNVSDVTVILVCSDVENAGHTVMLDSKTELTQQIVKTDQDSNAPDKRGVTLLHATGLSPGEHTVSVSYTKHEFPERIRVEFAIVTWNMTGQAQ